MVRVWTMDNEDTDCRLDHQLDPPEYGSIGQLFEVGVEYFEIDPKNYNEDPLFCYLREKRGFAHEDEITISKETLPNYEETIQSYFAEHLHDHPEIRLVLEGSGYFDMRDKLEKWIRIAVKAGDMLIIPAGIYHRFTVDTNNIVKVRRCYVNTEHWTSHPRPADDLDCRKEYLDKVQEGWV